MSSKPSVKNQFNFWYQTLPKGKSKIESKNAKSESQMEQRKDCYNNDLFRETRRVWKLICN